MAFAYSVRKRGNFNPDESEPFRISRSKIDLFVECPRCFYLDQRFGVKRPDTPPFSLNNAVDLLLKKEFDIHRAAGSAHPLMKRYGLDMVPFAHPSMDKWRDAFRNGIEYLHVPTNLSVRGGIDDVWVYPNGELAIVDYKATSKTAEITLDAEWQDGYKRQMEVYQWLFRKNGFRVSDTGYFVYVNGRQDKEAFDGKLEFDLKIIPYTGNDSWVEKILPKIKECLMFENAPKSGETCGYCPYREMAGRTLLSLARRPTKTVIHPVRPSTSKKIAKKHGDEKYNAQTLF